MKPPRDDELIGEVGCGGARRRALFRYRHLPGAYRPLMRYLPLGSQLCVVAFVYAKGLEQLYGVPQLV
jgi:hypothetical protein